MKKLIITLVAVLSFFSLPEISNAATLKVTWTDYEKYRDIKSGSESRKHFRERVFSDLEKHFAKLASSLPEDQVLKIDVTDVDLAGDTLSGGINQLRIVKDIYLPRMHFSYRLVHADGSVIASDNVVLKDINFMMGNNLKYRNTSLGYEKKMLDDWFTDTFKLFVVDKK